MSRGLRLFIVGGTGEGRQVATKCYEAGMRVMTSLAGVSVNPRLPLGSVSVGGFGGFESMADFLRRWEAQIILDCAHPFAGVMKRRILELSENLGLPLWVYRRSAWCAESGDDWHYSDDLEQAFTLARSLGGRIFAALGQQQLPLLEGLIHDEPCQFLLFRQAPQNDSESKLIRHSESLTIISEYPSVEIDKEKQMLKTHAIEVIICKDSGGEASFAKLIAARQLHIPVVMIRQPQIEYPKHVNFFTDSEQLIKDFA